MGVLKMYPSQRQALEELLDAGDDMSAAIENRLNAGNCHCETCQSARDWRELRLRYRGLIDRLKNR